MRGRKPKPYRQQIAEGDRSKRGVKMLDAKAAAQPKAVRGLPPCPKYLPRMAREAWKWWKQELECMELDCRADAQMLQGACINFARAVEADKRIQKEGTLSAEPILDTHRRVVGKRMRPHPAVAISNTCWRNVRSFCSEFGLSPVSRTRLTTDRIEDDGEELMRLLTAPRVPKSGPSVQ